MIWTPEAILKICGLLYQIPGGTGGTHSQSRWADRRTGLAQEGQPVLPGLRNTASLGTSVGEETDIHSILKKFA